ncbi:dihydroxyacetone kinase subunit DhaL [Apibacter adventoris]|uniref:dihydroxyacetone kinase subunit DhaL n=1 Tax=Apibacter adventoris TaxID=1679466 RepID=UPI0015E38D0B|nr:dihydroxyacetone kinase subunit DhaL [Apibacter adventoris]
MTEALNVNSTKEMLIYIADKIIESKPFLTEVDSKIGDGDHGIGMAGGLQKAKNKLLTLDNISNVYDLFNTVGKTMLMSMGGASGVIFGSLFLAGSKNVDPKTELNAQDIAEIMEKGLISIKERGKAQVGDKTMIDALEPAVESLKANSSKGLHLMLLEAEAAAAQGVENTKKYVAKFGRAKSLMERAIGYQDAGATSVWIIFRSMREYVEKK